MSKPSPRRTATIERRTFLKGATAGLAVTSGLEGILASQRAPAFAQGAEIHLLQWVDFIPEGDAELRRQCAEYSSQTKTKVTVETINANDLQARITAAIQSGSGPDIIMMLHNWPHLYASALGDVADLCEWKAKDQGGYYAHSEAAAKSGKRWLALPYTTGGSLIAYRRSWFAEVGANGPPKTLEEYRKIGMALKKKGKPVGQTLGHTFGDAPTWTYPLTWAFGGMETDPSGKKVAINSPKTAEAVKWMTSFWKDACDEGALAWDDTNNNRAFHANEISATLNGASIYIFAKRNPDKVKNEAGQPMFSDISHFGIPDGAKRRHLALLRGLLPRPHEVFEESEGGQGVPQVAPHQGPVQQVVRDRERLQRGRYHHLGEQPHVGQGRRRAEAFPGRRARLAHDRMGRPAHRARHRGTDQVHHHGHVRQGRPGNHPHGLRQVGGSRAQEGIRRLIEA